MSVKREELLNTLRNILLRIGAGDADMVRNADEQTELAGELGLDSSAMLFLVIVLEEELNVVFKGVGINQLRTVRDVIDYIIAYKEKKS